MFRHLNLDLSACLRTTSNAPACFRALARLADDNVKGVICKIADRPVHLVTSTKLAEKLLLEHHAQPDKFSSRITSFSPRSRTRPRS